MEPFYFFYEIVSLSTLTEYSLSYKTKSNN